MLCALCCKLYAFGVEGFRFCDVGADEESCSGVRGRWQPLQAMDAEQDAGPPAAGLDRPLTEGEKVRTRNPAPAPAPRNSTPEALNPEEEHMGAAG